MFVFGGSLTPSEEFSNELWQLNLSSLQWSPLFSLPNLSSSDSYTLPLAVRGHTAHVVGSKMVVLLGFAKDLTCLTFVQEYNFSESFTGFLFSHF